MDLQVIEMLFAQDQDFFMILELLCPAMWHYNKDFKWKGMHLNLHFPPPFNHCAAEMRIFICIKSVKVRYICPANQQFFCDDENPFFYGSIKKSYLVPHGRMKLMICPQDYDDYHHKSKMETKAT